MLGSATYMRAWSCLSVLGIALLGIFPPKPAFADDRAREADALFEEARGLMVGGKYAEACPKLEKSESLDPGIGTQLNLARCYDLAGKPASAWALYQRVIDATHQAGQGAREDAARQLQMALAPRVPHATVRPTPDAERIEGLEIRCDGVPIARSAWGRPSPLDPGQHVVEASAPRSEPWRTSFVLAKEGQSLEIEVPALRSLASEAPPPREAAAEASPSLLAPMQRKIALATFGASVIAAGAGAYFGLRAVNLGSQSQDNCPDNHCNADGLRQHDDSKTAGNVSTGLFIGSGALLATSAILWFTAPRARAARDVLVTPVMTASGGSVLVTGTWR